MLEGKHMDLQPEEKCVGRPVATRGQNSGGKTLFWEGKLLLTTRSCKGCFFRGDGAQS